MINFRYHLVSLAAVFLALAVGVVLGAGPLQNKLAKPDESVESVESLTERLAVADKLAAQDEQFIWAVADEVLAGLLNQTSVVVVALPGAEVQPALSRALERSGAEVHWVMLPESWMNSDQRAYRETLSKALSSHLTSRPTQSGADAILAQALVEVLTSAGPQVDLLQAMLTDDKTPLLALEDVPSSPADAVVLVGPEQPEVVVSGQDAEDGSGQSGYGPATTLQTSSSLEVALANAAGTVRAAVAQGSAADADGFIAVLRADGVRISTVDQGGSAMAAINTALALVDSQSGAAPGAYGQQRGATSALAPIPDLR